MLHFHISDQGSFQALAKVLGDLPVALQRTIAYPALKKAAGVLVTDARKNATFRARRGSLGLMGTFQVVGNTRTRRVYANYGGKRHRHAHLIEFGTAMRPRRGRVKPHGILRKAFRRKEGVIIHVMEKEMQKQISNWADQAKRGRYSRTLQTVMRREARRAVRTR